MQKATFENCTLPGKIVEIALVRVVVLEIPFRTLTVSGSAG